MSNGKAMLRSKLIKDRLMIGHEDWKERSATIAERIAQNKAISGFADIALYKSFRNEVDVSPLMELLPDRNFYFPRTDLESGTMDFLLYESPKAFQKNRWGLEEPLEGVPLQKSEGVLIIVPALAFDKQGYRLGYGKGFYDRFLSGAFYATVGVCFSEFLYEDLPKEPHDRRVNIIVTELGSLDVTPSLP